MKPGIQSQSSWQGTPEFRGPTKVAKTARKLGLSQSLSRMCDARDAVPTASALFVEDLVSCACHDIPAFGQAWPCRQCRACAEWEGVATRTLAGRDRNMMKLRLSQFEYDKGKCVRC